MEIILKKDVENLGLEFDTVNVKPGYARNFLIPQGFALLATPKNKAALEATLEARKEEEAKLVAAATAIVEKLKATPVTITAKAGVEVDKKYIKIPGNTIKRTGKFSAKVRPHRNVEYEYEFEVVSDAPVAEAAKTEEA